MINNREDRCVQLALEGERLCKKGSWHSGISHFEEAIKAGTSDLQTLSAVYSQLGNAYFYLHDYQRALLCHRQDLTLAKQMGDKIGEAKACGNLGNTLKALGDYDEAIRCCKLHLELSQQIKDKVCKKCELLTPILHKCSLHNLLIQRSLMPCIPAYVKTTL